MFVSVKSNGRQWGSEGAYQSRTPTSAKQQKKGLDYLIRRVEVSTNNLAQVFDLREVEQASFYSFFVSSEDILGVELEPPRRQALDISQYLNSLLGGSRIGVSDHRKVLSNLNLSRNVPSGRRAVVVIGVLLAFWIHVMNSIWSFSSLSAFISFNTSASWKTIFASWIWYVLMVSGSVIS
jgi:hypothetical protein